MTLSVQEELGNLGVRGVVLDEAQLILRTTLRVDEVLLCFIISHGNPCESLDFNQVSLELDCRLPLFFHKPPHGCGADWHVHTLSK